MIDDRTLNSFQQTVWDFYHDHGRHDLLWRQPEADNSFDPYKIMVSEIMLQQTQVARITSKYREFLELFPAASTLAAAEQGDVIRAWSGLGYNRRAKFLHAAAQMVVSDFKGRFPENREDLMRLPGIGANTAGAILAYAFNQPVCFLETNIRTVLIHHFFQDDTNIPDSVLQTFGEATLDRQQPREWYWALMDYGSYLKQTVGNLNRQSKTYAKQSKFEGSKRQIRGQVLRLLASKDQNLTALQSTINDDRLSVVIADLVREGLIQEKGGRLSL